MKIVPQADKKRKSKRILYLCAILCSCDLCGFFGQYPLFVGQGRSVGLADSSRRNWGMLGHCFTLTLNTSLQKWNTFFRWHIFIIITFLYSGQKLCAVEAITSKSSSGDSMPSTSSKHFYLQSLSSRSAEREGDSLGSSSPINPLIEIASPLLSLPRTTCVIPALVEWYYVQPGDDLSLSVASKCGFTAPRAQEQKRWMQSTVVTVINPSDGTSFSVTATVLGCIMSTNSESVHLVVEDALELFIAEAPHCMVIGTELRMAQHTIMAPLLLSQSLVPLNLLNPSFEQPLLIYLKKMWKFDDQCMRLVISVFPSKSSIEEEHPLCSNITWYCSPKLPPEREFIVDRTEIKKFAYNQWKSFCGCKKKGHISPLPRIYLPYSCAQLPSIMLCLQ